MFTSDTLADAAGAILIEKTEERLRALPADHGASQPDELPRSVQAELLRRATVETAAVNFPTANLDQLDHGSRSFTHPASIAAMERMSIACKSAGDAFEMTRGMHAAVVLAVTAFASLPSICGRCVSQRNRATTLTWCSTFSPATRERMSAIAVARRRSTSS